MFEAHNTESAEGEAVLVFVDGEEDAVKGFLAQARSKRPARSEVSGIFSDGFEGEQMDLSVLDGLIDIGPPPCSFDISSDLMPLDLIRTQQGIDLWEYI